MKNEVVREAVQLVRLGKIARGSPSDVVSPPQPGSVKAWILSVLFVLPVVAALLYNFVIATPRYVSQMAFVVRSIDSSRERISLSGISQSNITADNSEIIADYIKSRDLLHVIDKDQFVTRMFRGEKVDYFSAFPTALSGASREMFHRHFLGYIDVAFNRATNITHIEIQAFDPLAAQRIASRVLKASELKVNQLNSRIRSNLVQGAEREVALASANLADTLSRLAAVRNRNAVLEPKLQSGAAIKLASAAAAELSDAEVQLSQTMRAAPASPLIGQLLARRASLEKELARLTSAAAGGPNSLAARMRSYEALDAQREIAEKRLMAASLSLVRARDSAGRQQLYISRISEPSVPDEPLYPRAWVNLLLTALICGALAWIAVSLAEVVFDDD
jgi:BexC/CtrB/KpsE family polysaccharide export inner-membrane protein